jgi:hypothetical protein
LENFLLFDFREILIKIDKPITDPHAAITKNINKIKNFKIDANFKNKNIFISINSKINKTEIKFRKNKIKLRSFKNIKILINTVKSVEVILFFREIVQESIGLFILIEKQENL